MINKDKTSAVTARYNELERLIADPEVIADRAAWGELCKEHTALAPAAELVARLDRAEKDLEDARALLSDPDMKELAEEEIAGKHKLIAELEEKLSIELLPKDPDDDKNVIIEVRAGAGGEEAALFAAELVRMYKMYADRSRLKCEDISVNATELGGVKEAVFMLSGAGAYGRLKYESGVHRVQRVPETETQVDIPEKDIRVDTYRSGGAGGQHINKTDSAVRMTHIPTGIVVCCEDERSQTQNREKAMKVLRSRVYDHYKSIAEKEYSDKRRSQVGTGDRSERIRTYNFPQGRVTDHRIGLSLYDIEDFMNGDLDEMLEALRLADVTARLSGEGNG